jgi:hypothetical protein
MLRALRRSTPDPMLRRLMALLLGVCVSVMLAEPLIADQCDDLVSQSATAGNAGGLTKRVVSVGVDRSPQSTDSEIPDGHALHLCHCSHVHSVTLATGQHITDRVDITDTTIVGHSVRLPSSVVVEPQRRPPRAHIA